MTVQQRSAGLILCGLIGLLAFTLAFQSAVLPAQPPENLFPAASPSEGQAGVMGMPPSSPEPPKADSVPEKLLPAASPAEPAEAEGTSCPVDPPTPVVAIRVRAPASAGVEKEITYRIQVENCSAADAHHVTVRNSLPANARFVRASPEPHVKGPELVWHLGTLEACACKDITLVLAATGPENIKNCARVQFEHGQCVYTRLARPVLSLHKTGPERASLNDTITFQLTVTNISRVEARNIVLTDELPDGLERVDGRSLHTWEWKSLAPGQSHCVEFKVIARKTGQMCNRSVVQAEGAARKEASHCVTVAESRIELRKIGPERAFASHPVTYHLTVTNPNATPLDNVVITETIPDRMTFVSATEGGRFAENQVRWQLGTLLAGERRTVRLVLRSEAPGEVLNTASAAADRVAPVESGWRTIFEKSVTGLTFGVEVEPNPVEVGRSAVYTITVINQGDVPATNVRITATAPEQMTVTDAKGQSERKNKDPREVEFEPVAVLPPRGSLVYEVYVQTLKAGDVRFKVDLTAAELPAGKVTREASTTIYVGPPNGVQP